MKVIDRIWFTSIDGHTVGIIVVKDEQTAQRKAYIGRGDGFNEEADTQHILNNGSRFHFETAMTIASELANPAK